MKKITMAALAACILAFANPAAAQVPNDVHAELNRLHSQLAENINHGNAGIQRCAATASRILNDLDWEARQAKNPDAWATIYRTMDTYATCLAAAKREAGKRWVCGQAEICQGQGTIHYNCRYDRVCKWVYPD